MDNGKTIKRQNAAFGPSGNSVSFAEEGFASSIQSPGWIAGRGLELFEYSLGQGIRISTATASTIAFEADKYNVEMSVHAPYFISFASLETEKAENSIRYILSSLKILRAFHGSRCVFHAGAEGKQPRAEAFARIKDMLAKTVEEIERAGYGDLIICPETMGKQAQIGTLDEVIEMCKIGKNVYPCVDFGHVNALYGGSLKTTEDFQRIIDRLFDGLGEEKTKNMHVHFSKIQYGAKGEIRHLTFADNEFGPRFEPLAEVIVKNSLTPHVLCESAGTQAEDAAYMKKIYYDVLRGRQN